MDGPRPAVERASSVMALHLRRGSHAIAFVSLLSLPELSRDGETRKKSP